MDRIALARDLLDDCESCYEGKHGPPPCDLPSFQSVGDYTTTTGQHKYTHMYFAKYLTLWRTVRRRVSVTDGAAVYAMGAGPGLCAFGWFWDQPAAPDRQVVFVDPLPWEGVHELPSHSRLVDEVIGTRPERVLGRVKLNGNVPRQLGGISSAPEFTPPAGSVVLLSFVANHIVGAKEKGVNHAAFWEPLKQLARAGSTVLIADISVDDAPNIWTSAPCKPNAFSFDSDWAREIYTTQGERRTSSKMRSASVIVGTASGWRSL